MKKSLMLFVTIFILVLNLKAQVIRGTWLVGGSGFFTNNNYKYKVLTNNSNSNLSYNQEVNNKNFNIGGNLGYFINNRLVIGISPFYSNNTATEKNALTEVLSSKETIISMGLFSRYYFLNPQHQKMNFIGEVAYGFTTHKLQNNETGKGKYSTIYIGPTYLISKNIGLEFLIGLKNDNLDYNYQKSFYKNSDFSAKLGFQIYLN